MMKRIGRIAACGSALVLMSACGGGGGSDTGRPSDAAALNSKDDALRELSLSGFVLGVVGGGIPDAGTDGGGTAPAAAKSLGRHGGWGAVPPVPVSTAKSGGSQGPCPGGGRSDITEQGSATHSFIFFGSQTATVDYEKGLDSQCVQAQQSGSTTMLMTYNGRHEHGSSGTLSNGSQFVYLRDGVAGEPYTQQYEEKENGTRVYLLREDLRGETEARLFADGAFEVRTIYSYRASDSDNFSARVDLGDGSTPFKGYSGTVLRLDGSYAYSNSECSGGKVIVSTLQPVTLDDNDNPNGGQVRLVSGGSSATFTFNNDGGAVLNLNGVTLSLPSAEVQAALNDVPC